MNPDHSVFFGGFYFRNYTADLHLTSDLNKVEMEKDKIVFYNQYITYKKKLIYLFKIC